jgi:hypothetical protein
MEILSWSRLFFISIILTFIFVFFKSQFFYKRTSDLIQKIAGKNTQITGWKNLLVQGIIFFIITFIIILLLTI